MQVKFLVGGMREVLLEPGVDLSGEDLSGLDFRGIDLSHANLSKANLTDANLVTTNLSFANLDYADLTGANLYKVNLSFASLHKANLRGVSRLNTAILLGTRGVIVLDGYLPFRLVVSSKFIHIGCMTRTLEEWEEYAKDPLLNPLTVAKTKEILMALGVLGQVERPSAL